MGSPDGNITTTIGQLNFKWAIQNNVIQYIEENLSEIEKDMNSNIRKKDSNKKKDGTGVKVEKTKRKQLSQNATKQVRKLNTETFTQSLINYSSFSIISVSCNINTSIFFSFLCSIAYSIASDSPIILPII